MRSAENRLKSQSTGTVHFAERGRIACGPVRTHAGWLRPTIEDVTCLRCIAKFGADEATTLRDPVATIESVERRAAERAERQAKRFAQ